MAERIRKSTSTSHTEEQQLEESKPSGSSPELVSELDDLLNEIDEVLETNAEEFVKNYVQKGGQ
jgi:ubiquitin-like protein Pup